MHRSFHSPQPRRRFVQTTLALASASLTGGALLAVDDKTPVAAKRVDPTEDLMREHGVLNRLLIVYEEAIRRLQTDEELPPEPVRDAAKLVRNYIEAYHEMLEENFLFQRFLNAGLMKDLVQVLLQQHVGGRNLTDEILHRATIGAVKSKDDRQRLAETLHKFVFMYHAHEAREDTELFPAFRGLVSAHEYDALREDFDKREREQFGGEAFPTIVEKVAAIEKQLGISDLARFTRGY